MILQPGTLTTTIDHKFTAISCNTSSAPPPPRLRIRHAIFVVAAPLLTLLCGGCPGDMLSGDKDGSAQSPVRVDAVTPNRGPVDGGTRVTIRGGPFQDHIGVLFGAHAAVDPIIVNSRMI